MWLASAPYRVAIAGGGSDVPQWCQHDPGAVFSFSLSQRIWVMAHASSSGKWLVRYRDVETADDISEIRNQIIREAVLHVHPQCPPLELSCHGEMPARNTGLGGSSAFTTALVALLLATQQRSEPPDVVASLAAEVEIGRLERKMGYQEIVSSAWGGARLLRFGPGDGIDAEIHLSGSALGRFRQYVQECGRLVQVSPSDEDAPVFRDYSANIKAIIRDRAATKASVALAHSIYGEVAAGRPERIFEALRTGWSLKKMNHDTPRFPGEPTQDGFALADLLTDRGFAAKLCGGGRTGFVFACAPDREQALSLEATCAELGLACLPVDVSSAGATARKLPA